MYGDYGVKSSHPHVGVAYLCSWLKKNNIEVDLFDDGLGVSRDKLLDKIKNTHADLIGLTMFSYCYQSGYDLINFIKEHTDIPLVIGGPHVSSTKTQILEETKADFSVKHEGEKPLLSLLNFIVKKRNDYGNIRGLIWRNYTGQIIENEDEKFLNSKELDAAPYPDLEAFELRKYDCYDSKTLPLITSRGCPYGCNYCSVRLSMGRNFRSRSALNVFEEISYWYNKGWTNFDINDDCFTLDMKRAHEICDMIIQSKIKIKFSLYNGIRADRVDYNLLKKMKEAGCVFLSFGCETGNDEILRKIQKGLTIKQVYKASKWAHSLGIKHSVNFIIGHTGETYKTAISSLSFARSLPCDFVNFYNLVPYPNTDAYMWVKKNGTFLVDEKDYLKYISYRDNTPIFETSEFTKEERIKIMKIGFNLYEKKALQFKLGKTLGLMSYYISRISFVHRIALRMLESKTVWKLLRALSK